MMAALSALAPNREAILQALEHLFGGLLDGLHDGLIEIASCEGQGGPNPKWHAHLYATDELEEAADYAVGENAQGRNVYVAPAIRKPDTPRDKRAGKAHVLGTVVLWAEWDEADKFNDARLRMQPCKPTLGCITGRTPATRAQAMWRIESAIRDIAEIEAAVAGLAAALGGEDDVWNADRLMRLPGSISWRKLNKPERIDEPTALQIKFSDGRPSIYPTEQVLRAYPPAKPKASAASGDPLPNYIYSRGPLGLNGDIVDKREKYLRDTVHACFIEYGGTTGSCPDPKDLFDIVWPQYSARTDLVSRPGRGMNECMEKCRYIVRRFLAGELPKLPDLESLVDAYQSRPKQPEPKPAAPIPPAPIVSTTPDGLYQLLDIAAMRRLPPVDWLIDQWLPEGGFAALYAPPKSLKSFLALDLLLHIATGRQWRGRATKQGAVLYVAGEGHRGAAKRVAAWLQHYQAGDDAPFYMTTHAIPMAEAGSVEKLIATIKAKVAEISRPVVLVCLDTVARSFGAGDENATKDMNAFIAGCDAVRHAVGASVLGVHHTGKDKERGMRGSTALLGGVDTVIKVDRDEERLTVEIEEQRDGEESDPLFFRALKIELAGYVKPTSSLVLVDAEAPAEGAKKDFITIDMANKILRRVQEAWNDGDPYSDAQRAGSEKWVGGLMVRQFGLTAGQAVSIIGHWRDNGIYRMEARTKTRKGGMCVLKWPGEVANV